MTVYVDSMKAPFGRMLMCHMIADTDEELHAMADAIGVSRRHHQSAGTARSHYDIAQTKRMLAVQRGAVPIMLRQCGAMCMRRAITGELGPPEEAEQWVRDWKNNAVAQADGR